MKKKILPSLFKTALLQAVENTYDNSRFLMGYGLKDDCDFRNGLSLNRHDKVSKNELLELIRHEALDEIISIPDHVDSLVLTPKMYVFRDNINDNQVIRTSAPEDYYHSVCKYNANLDVYIKLDKVKKTISFLLGDTEKTLALEEYSGFVSKPSGKRLMCVTADDLERHILDEFWNPRMIRIGRYILHIKPAV